MSVKVTYHEFRKGKCALGDKQKEEKGAVVTMPGFKKIFLSLEKVHELAEAMDGAREEQEPPVEERSAVKTPRVAAS